MTSLLNVTRSLTGAIVSLTGIRKFIVSGDQGTLQLD
jgi:hypothetical protein